MASSLIKARQLAAEVLKTDGSVASAADQDMGSHKIVNVSTPTASTDAANKSYVDAALTGIRAKTAARAATTTTLPACTYSNGTAGVGATLTGNSNGALAAVDGVTLAATEYLLVKNQASGLQNGLYQLTTLGDGSNPFVLTRSTDADTAAKVLGMFVFIEEGTANADTGWLCTTDATITMGTTALTFVKFTSTVSVPTFVTRETPSGTINGSNVTFTLANTPTSGAEELYLNGQLLDSGGGNDYTISSATITMATAPVSGDKLRANYRY